MQVARPDRLLIDATRGLGRLVIGSVQAVGQLAVLLVQVVRALLADPQRRRTIVDQLYRIGYLSLPVVILTGLATGLVLAVQAYHTLAKVQGETMVGAMVNYTIITELGPVLTGLMLAGRVGSAIAAELGSMKVTEQLDRLRLQRTEVVDVAGRDVVQVVEAGTGAGDSSVWRRNGRLSRFHSLMSGP